jgi:protein-tyrosine phosphatase
LIDIHCHILPGIDDGPASIQDALKMARLAAKDGVHTIVATPHCFDGVYNCQGQDVVARCEEFNAVLAHENIDLTVLPGAEVRLTPELSQAISEGRVLTLADSLRWLLLELPEMFIPDAVVMSIRSMQKIGITTIIAHPERNSMILGKPEVLARLVEAGAQLQLTADSVLGGFGKDAKRVALQILNMNARCYLGSDGHCARKRKPILAKAVKVAAKHIGNEAANDLVSIHLEVAPQKLRKNLYI